MYVWCTVAEAISSTGCSNRFRSITARSANLPTSIDPVVVVEVVHVGRAHREAGEGGREVEALLGQEHLAVLDLVRVVGRHLAVDGDVDLFQRVGAGDAPVAPHRQRGTRPDEAAERVLPAPAGLAEERDRQVVHLRFVRRPERLGVGDGAELAEPRDVVGMHDLEMREVVAAVRSARSSAAPLRSRRATPAPRARRARGNAPGSPAASSRVTASLQQLRVDEGDAAVVGLGAVGVEVGLSTAAVKFSQTPSCMILTLVAAKRPATPPARWSIRASICSRPCVAVPPERAHHPGGELAGRRRAQVRVEVVGPADRRPRWRPARP